MTTVTLENGTKLNFESGASDEMIHQAVDEYVSKNNIQPKAAPSQQNNDPYKAERENINDKLRLGFQGLSFGTGSSIIAAGKTLGTKAARAIEKGVYGDNMIPDTTYKEQKQLEDKNLEGIRDKQGIVNDLIAEGVGGIASGGALVKAGEKAIAASPALSKVAAQTPKFIKNIAIGAGFGGLNAAGESKGQNISDIASDVRSGAELGGALGVGAPVVAKAVGAVGTSIARAFGFNPSGESLLAKNLTPSEAKKALESLTSDSRTGLLESGNRKVNKLAKQVAKQPTEGGDLLNQELVQSARESTDATKNILKGIGDGGNYFKNVDDIIDQRAKAAGPLFKKSYEEGANIPQNDNLSALLGDERIESALNKARKDYGIKSPDNSVETLHGVRQVIDDTIGSAVKQGENNKARAYRKLRGEINDVIYDASPTLKQADQTFSGFSAIKNAYEEGAAFKADKTAEEFQRTVSKFQDNPSQLEGFKNGVTQSLLKDIISIGSQSPNPAQKVIGSELNREKLKFLFKDPEEYNNVVKRLNDEVAIVNTKARIVGKEPSAITAADDDTIFDQILKNPFSGSVKVLANIISKKYHGLDEKNTMEIAKILTNKDLSIDALTKIAAKGGASTKQTIVDLLPKVIAGQIGGKFVSPEQSNEQNLQQ